MNIRIHPAVLNELVKSTDMTFDNYFVRMLDEMLTEDVMKELCEERYKVLMESITDYNENPAFFTSSTQRYLHPDDVRVKKSFESLILCYASVGIIPVTQSKLGKVVEQFINTSGGWKTSSVLYKDAMAFRLPGSFETRKR